MGRRRRGTVGSEQLAEAGGRAALPGAPTPAAPGTDAGKQQRQIIRSFKGQKAVVLGTLPGEEMPQSKRNSEGRRLLAGK